MRIEDLFEQDYHVPLPLHALLRSIQTCRGWSDSLSQNRCWSTAARVLGFSDISISELELEEKGTVKTMLHDHVVR